MFHRKKKHLRDSLESLNVVNMKIKKSLGIQGWSNSSALRKQTIWVSFLDGSELCHTVIQTFFQQVPTLSKMMSHPSLKISTPNGRGELAVLSQACRESCHVTERDSA